MPDQGSSFIPKSGVRTVKRTGTARRIYILAYISYIVFFTTLFVVIGVYLYSASINSSLNATKNQLNLERQRFAVSEIETVRSLDKRLKVAATLLNESSAPSRIFSDIEKIVASNIYFTSMSYKVLPNKQFKVDLVGRANNFNQVINQRELLKNSEILEDATIASYDYIVANEGGSFNGSFENTVLTFTFSDTRDLSLISYKINEAESMVIVNPPTEDNSSASTESSESTSVSGDENVVVSPATPTSSGQSTEAIDALQN